jgi:RNA polymerase sigma-70 factor, ECF subfamily
VAVVVPFSSDRRRRGSAVRAVTEPGSEPAAPSENDRLAELMQRTARGDEDAFAELYDHLAGPVYGLIRRVLRDPAQSQEVAQEVMVEVWRQATRYDATKGSVKGYVMTVAHRRAIDRVRSAQSSTDRELRVGRSSVERDYDQVSEAVEHKMEVQQVRRALDVLTNLQREAVQLAYYGGYTHREVSDLLGVPLGTVKTRLRDGLIRLRDEMGVAGT